MIKISSKKTDKLVPSARNARIHSDEQVAQIARSMKEFGFLNPILIDAKDGIIAGHGRVLAAKKLGLKDVPCIIVTGLDDNQLRALAIADNKIPLNATWDEATLKAEIDELMKANYNLEVLAMGGDEFAAIYGLAETEGKTEDDEVPAPTEEITSKLGDLWILGEHRVLCGDSTNPDHINLLMDTGKAACIFTDPPYRISYDTKDFDVIEGDKLREDALASGLLIPALTQMARVANDEAGFYIWHGVQTREDFCYALKAAGLKELQYLIWQKPGMVLGNQDYRSIYEPCFYAVKDGHKPKFYGGRDEPNVWLVSLREAKARAAMVGRGIVVLDGKGGKIIIRSKDKTGKLRSVRVDTNKPLHLFGEDRSSTIWEIAKDSSKYVHPTQKPVELATRAITNSSVPGEIILDAFLGSGTTVIAAEKLKRRAFGLDIDPKYIDVVIRRWQDFTGFEARLASNDRTYEAMKKTRAKKTK